MGNWNLGMIYFHDGFSVRRFFPNWGETSSGIENKSEHLFTSKKTKKKHGKKNVHKYPQIEHNILMKHLPDNPGNLLKCKCNVNVCNVM